MHELKSPNKFNIFISTGEVSGDLQGSMLIAALKRQASARNLELNIVALGGDRMVTAGATLLGDTSGIGSVGILESIPYILPTLQIQKQAKKYLQQNPPDLVVLIDYVGPNLGLLQFLTKNLPLVPIVYYIAPQDWIWAVSPRNTTRIVAHIKRLLAIFPGEARYFAEKGAAVSWVGHPLIDRLQTTPDRATAREILGISSTETAIALFPASRQQEIKYLLPIMFTAAKQIQDKLPNVSFWIPLSLPVYREAIASAIQNYGLHANIVEGKANEVISAVDLAITKSGTVNLEIALLNVPQVVIYRVNSFTWWVATKLFNFSIPFMSPVNLVQMKSIVPELLQAKATPENIVSHALELLLNADRRQETINEYQEMRRCLGEVGVCDRAAKEILEILPVNHINS